MAKFKVLLVDDVKLSIDMEKSALSRTESEIFTAMSGEEALEIAKRELPDIVILDLFMPGMKGDECCRIIKADPSLKHIPIIMTSTGEIAEEMESCFDAGCDDFIAKPFRSVDLMKKVAAHFDMVVRDYSRAPLMLEAHFAVEGQSCKGYLHDLSEDGAFVKSDHLFPVGTVMILVITMPDKRSTIEAEARVMRVVEEPVKFNADIVVGMGVQFVSLTEDAEDFIRDYVGRAE